MPFCAGITITEGEEMRPIDADKLIDNIETINYVDYNNYWDTFYFIYNAPTIETNKAKRGHWESPEYLNKALGIMCSCCKTENYIFDLCIITADLRLPGYCPNCGAKMNGDEENGAN